MLEVRNLFEADIDLDKDGESEFEKELASTYHQQNYSRFYYFAETETLTDHIISDITDQYMYGCKLYCVFSKKAQMLSVLNTQTKTNIRLEKVIGKVSS